MMACIRHRHVCVTNAILVDHASLTVTTYICRYSSMDLYGQTFGTQRDHIARKHVHFLSPWTTQINFKTRILRNIQVHLTIKIILIGIALLLFPDRIMPTHESHYKQRRLVKRHVKVRFFFKYKYWHWTANVYFYITWNFCNGPIVQQHYIHDARQHIQIKQSTKSRLVTVFYYIVN